MYLVRPPFFLKWYYPGVLWRKSKTNKTLYLTFDDGPVPEVTPFVLNVLEKYAVKATFFCVGQNIEKHPDIFTRLKSEGHRIGNHTHHHLKGWEHNDEDYLNNIHLCQEHTRSSLFRPPYGRMKRSQLKEIRKEFEVVMWDVLSGDFDTGLSPEACFGHVKKYTRPGSIIVFHDNPKAFPRLEYALPQTIEYFQKKGFNFGLL